MRINLSLAWGWGRVQGGAPAWALLGVLALGLPARGQSAGIGRGDAAPASVSASAAAGDGRVFGPGGGGLSNASGPAPAVPARRLDVREASMTSMALSWAGAGDLARVAVTLDNVGRQRVTLHWALAAPGARRVLVEQPLELSFVPTVVTRRSPRDDRLYVAGWAPDERKVVLEEWRLLPLSLRAVTGDDGVARTALAPALPEARRRRLYDGHRFDGLAPLSGLACDVPGERLWLLAEGPVSRLATLDLVRGRLVPAEDLAALADHDLTCRWIDVGRHRWEGTLYVVQPRLPWEPRDADDDELLVLTDADRDGTIDRIERTDRARFAEAYPADGWLTGAFERPPRP